MLRAIARNTVLIGGLVIGAAITGSTASMLMSERGALGPGILEAVFPGRAIVALVISLAATAIVAIIVSRACNTAVGMFAAGGALFGLAWRLETADELVHIGSLGGVALETVIWAGLVLGVTLLVFRFGGPLRDVPPDDAGAHPHPILSMAALQAAAAGALVIPIVWLVAQTPMKGQVLGAVFVGAMVAGIAGRLLSPHVQPILLFAAPVFFGAVGHAIGAAMLSGSLADAWAHGAVPKLNFPMPVDYAAASMMGVAVGLGWARSFMHQEPEHERELVPPSQAV